jgi:hypothetical protein
MDAGRLAMIGALVQQQNQNLLRLQQVVDRRRREREEGETELCWSDSGYIECLNTDCMAS